MPFANRLADRVADHEGDLRAAIVVRALHDKNPTAEVFRFGA
jgi:hypothetical protein